MMRPYLLVLLVLLTGEPVLESCVHAGESTLLFSDDFNRKDGSEEKDGIGNGWGANSAWRADGQKQVFLNGESFRLITAPGADHAAVMFHAIEPAARDWTIEIRFRMKPGQDFAVDLNDPECKEVHSGHLANVAVRRGGITLKDSKTGVMKKSIRERRQRGDVDQELKDLLATKQVTIPFKPQPDRWQVLRITTRNDLMKVSIDGESIGQLKSPGIAHPGKRKLSITAKKSPEIDQIKVWSEDQTGS